MPTHNIPFGQPMLDKDEIDAVTKVLKGPILAHGSVCLEFEEAFAKHIGVDHAISVSSGTSGLHLSLFSRQIGLGGLIMYSCILVFQHPPRLPLLSSDTSRN